MAINESLEAFETVFGQAEGQLEQSNSSSSRSSVLSEFLPFLFSLSAKDACHLRFCVSDFHSQTWQSDFSVSQLVDLMEDVGIGRSLDDFLTYLTAALSSSNVKLLIGVSADAVGSATTATVVAQKTPGTPVISLPLKKLEGSAADYAKGSIAFGNFQAVMALSSALTSEKAEVSRLKVVLAAEKSKHEGLQEQINASSLAFTSRSKLNRGLSHASAGVSQQVVVPSLPAIVSGTSKDGKEAPKAPENNNRVHVPPTSRRVKRRGTTIRERTDE